MGRLTEGSIRTEGDCLEADAELLVLDDLVGATVLGSGVESRCMSHDDASIPRVQIAVHVVLLGYSLRQLY